MVCLMVGHVVEREVESSVSATATPSPTNQPSRGSGGSALRSSIYKQESNGSFPSEQELLDEKKLEVAVALSMLVGLFQVNWICTLMFILLFAYTILYSLRKISDILFQMVNFWTLFFLISDKFWTKILDTLLKHG